jgi:hypothetical protein
VRRILVAAAVVLLSAAGCGGGGGGGGGTAPATAGSGLVELEEQGGSGISGTATFLPGGDEGASEMTVSLRGGNATLTQTDDEEQAGAGATDSGIPETGLLAHVREGTCAEPGTIVHDLGAVAVGDNALYVPEGRATLGGRIFAIVSSSLDEEASGEGDAAGRPSVVACGTIDG